VNRIHYPNAVLIRKEAKITLRECRLGGYKLSDWYTHCLEAKLNDACVGLNDYTHAGNTIKME